MTIGMLISAIGVVVTMFLAITGVYLLIIKHMKNTSSELGRIYNLINIHIQNTGLHPEVDKVVAIAVCNEVQKRHEVLLDGVKRDISLMSKQVDKLDEEMTKKVDKLDRKLEGMANNLTKLVEKL